MEIGRTFKPLELLEKKSFFFFGPRSTGKTSLLKKSIDGSVPSINLLQSRYFLPLSYDPAALVQMIGDSKFAIIDEIQKLPALLDEVHHLIESKNIHFILTGSSARKLKQENANMLGGRATKVDFFPLTWKELSDAKNFDLQRFLRFGSLPRVYLSETPEDELFDYVDVYLKEEIRIEANVRKLPEFSRFLKIAALANGQLVNYANVANDIGSISAQSIKNFFEILDDTLLGFALPPWKSGKSRKSVSTAKHYIFDCGVVHALSGTKHLERNSSIYGDCFEQFIINEIRAFISYRRKRTEISFWRTKHGDEVDLILDDAIAIEIKSTTRVNKSDAIGIQKIAEEGKWQKRILISQDEVERNTESNLRFVHWEVFLKELWNNQIF